MPRGLDGSALAEAAETVARVWMAHTAEFNALDGVGGDGDMGTTLSLVAQAILADAEPPPTDVGSGFMRLAKIIAKTSGSSLSAVLMTGLMTAAQSSKEQAELTWPDVSKTLKGALVVMHQRSRAKLGDKTILDSLDAIAQATAQAADAPSFAAAARQAVRQTLEDFRERPATMGRLRLAPNKGVGHDDPGMVALKVAVEALAGRG